LDDWLIEIRSPGSHATTAEKTEANVLGAKGPRWEPREGGVWCLNRQKARPRERKRGGGERRVDYPEKTKKKGVVGLPERGGAKDQCATS